MKVWKVLQKLKKELCTKHKGCNSEYEVSIHEDEITILRTQKTGGEGHSQYVIVPIADWVKINTIVEELLNREIEV